MNMTRRNFAAVVAVPVGALAIGAVALPSLNFTAEAKGVPGKGRGRFNDPLLAQLNADLHGLAKEARTKPNGRKGTVRAMELLIGVTATHFAQHYDAGLTERIQQGIRTHGTKEAWIARALVTAPQSALTVDRARQGLDLLDTASLGGRLREAAANLGTVRAKLSDDGAYRPVIYMNCSDLLRTVEHYGDLAATLGMFAIVEPGPFFEAGALAAGFVWLTYRTAYYMQC